MKRIIWFSLIAGGIGAAVAVAGPFRSRGAMPQPAQPAQPAQTIVHRTWCPDWSSQARLQQPLIWVLDGAGDLKGCSNALSWANMVADQSIELNVFPWSHGYRRLYKDQTDSDHARQQGQRLAQAILERKASEPGRRVVVVAHSAGCAVALAAGDALPIGAVDRFILLAPSVSTGYDIRPTLWSATEGVDVFCSKKDWVALGFVTRFIGTTDRFWAAAAGRWGFKPKGDQALADAEEARLRQHFWTENMAWTGHTGGHHGMHSPDFVITYLMPLMTGEAVMNGQLKP